MGHPVAVQATEHSGQPFPKYDPCTLNCFSDFCRCVVTQPEAANDVALLYRSACQDDATHASTMGVSLPESDIVAMIEARARAKQNKDYEAADNLKRVRLALLIPCVTRVRFCVLPWPRSRHTGAVNEGCDD